GKANIEIIDIVGVFNSYFASHNLVDGKISAPYPIKVTADIIGDNGEWNIEDIKIDSKLIRGKAEIEATFIETKPIIDIGVLLDYLDIDNILPSRIERRGNEKHSSITEPEKLAANNANRTPKNNDAQ